MPLFKKDRKFSKSPEMVTDENISPDMDEVEKWLDDVEEKSEFEDTETEEILPTEDEPKWKKVDVKATAEKPKEKIMKKKTRVGIRRKEKKQKEETIPEENLSDELEEADEIIKDDIIEDEIVSNQDEEKKSFTSKKKKPIIKKDMKGKPVYLEDTGEKLGIVFDSIYDKKSNLVGFKIKDRKSDAVLSFSLDQFDENKDGLIFLPGWYTNAIKLIEKLEFKDKISPELTALLSDDAASTKELYDIFVKHDDDMADYIDDAVSLKEVLYNRLKVLEKQRLSMKEELIDLTEKRLIKDIDRREFSQDVMEHRRKVNILDLNIDKCKNLIQRLEGTSFGMLGKDKIIIKDDAKESESIYEKLHHDFKGKKQVILKDDIQMPYKEKYYALKEQFNQLEEEYQELKSSVEKLFNRTESHY